MFTPIAFFGKKGGLILDNYTTAIAYSLRKLRSNYIGNCLRIRRSSDNTTKDIGFKNNYLDWEDALDFVGTGAGFVEIWYDQSGNANNISQSILAEQPRLIQSGAAVDLTRFISRNGQIGMLCDDGSQRHLRADSGDILKVLRAKSHLQTYTVTSNDSNVGSVIMHISVPGSSTTAASRHLVDYNTGLRTGGRRLDSDGFSGTSPGTYTSDLILATSILNHSADRNSIYQNGTLVNTRSPYRGTGITSDTDSAVVVIGALSNKTLPLTGIISECIIFNTDLESERSKIENNIINYYSLV